MTIKKRVIWLIAISALLKIALAATIELGNDEVYYWTYALQPDWNHFDHPPLVGLFIRFFTFNLHLKQELFLRLTSIISGALCTFLLYRLTSRLHKETAGWYAALLYTSSFYCSIISGLLILPDSPQMLFWVISLHLIADIFVLKPDQPNRMLLLGACIALTTMCKVHGVLLWAAPFLYILVYRRDWLKKWQLYVALLIFAVVVSPIVFWNIKNHFITYTFHGARVNSTGGVFKPLDLLRELLGEILYSNPLNYILYVLMVIAMLRRQFKLEKKLTFLLFSCSLPLLGMVWVIASFNPTLPHWSGPGFIGLIILTAMFLSRNAVVPLLLKMSLALSLTGLVCSWSYLNFYPGSMGSKEQARLGEGDPTLDMFGWHQLKLQFEKIRQQDIRNKEMSASSPVISDKWFPAGHIEFYVAGPLNIPTLGAGPLKDIHQFAWLNYNRKKPGVGDNCYFISPSNFFTDPAEHYAKYFKSISQPVKIPVKRGGKTVKYYYLYRLTGCIDPGFIISVKN